MQTPNSASPVDELRRRIRNYKQADRFSPLFIPRMSRKAAIFALIILMTLMIIAIHWPILGAALIVLAILYMVASMTFVVITKFRCERQIETLRKAFHANPRLLDGQPEWNATRSDETNLAEAMARYMQLEVTRIRNNAQDHLFEIFVNAAYKTEGCDRFLHI